MAHQEYYHDIASMLMHIDMLQRLISLRNFLFPNWRFLYVFSVGAKKVNLSCTHFRQSYEAESKEGLVLSVLLYLLHSNYSPLYVFFKFCI